MKTALVRKGYFSGERVDVIYNGIPLPPRISSSRHSSNGSFHVGAVGRMVPVKDFDLFLEVAAEIKKHIKDVRFSILGDGPLKQQLRRRSGELEIEDCIEFLPPRPDPFSYYQSLDLLLCTSLHEGFPMSILEAMACGKPVVAAKVGGIPEVISNNENGLLLDAREPKEFAHVCLSLLQNRDLNSRLGKSASLKVLGRFTSLKMAEAYTQLYRELCTKS